MISSVEADKSTKDEAADGKKNSRTGVIVFVLLFIAVCAVGGYFISNYFKESDVPKKFTAGEMSIVLTEDFKQSRMGNYAACFDSRKVSVFASKEDFESSAGSENMSVEEYGKTIIDNNKIQTSGLKNKDSLYYFVHDYTNSDSGVIHEYYSFVYKSKNAFWIFQFAAPKKDIDKYAQKFFKWAETVEFAE